ncbi:hypothetical protein [Dongia sedimenti]|uniref:ATP-binding protein n=1 Tax=Dongia sedimenti TaxID=3064282 RepID=A0ABU0YTI3_9PROT|nr:ATP-binding protein [Rhodospirillaceae bacterium R-7]
MTMIDAMRSIAVLEHGSVYVDLNEIAFISPAATLLLVAELDRWRRLKNIKLRPRDIETMHDQVLYSLASMGFFNILGTHNLPPFTTDPGAPQPIRFCSGNQSDLKKASDVSAELQRIAGASLGQEELLLNDAIAEAMTNSVQHAYPSSLIDGLPVLKGEWWATGSYDQTRHRLTVLVYDQGIGIPATLPSSKHWDRITKRIPGYKELWPEDARLIEAAIEEGRSSKLTEGRGLGLAEIADLVYNSDGGHLRIISGRGEVRIQPGVKTVLQNHQRPLGGTLVEIALTLS